MNAHVRIEAAHAVAPAPLWEGSPAWRSAALRIWKVRLVALYFVVLLADGARVALASARETPAFRAGDAALVASAAGTLGVLLLLAWLTARTTRYSIEPGRIVMRIGIALRARLEIPFAAIDHVAIRVHPDHTGDITLRLKPGQSVSYLKLWPHARPWRWVRPEPMLRCVPSAGAVGALLSREMRDARVRAAAVGDRPLRPAA